MRKLSRIEEYMPSGEAALSGMRRKGAANISLLFRTRRRRLALLALSLVVLVMALVGCVTFGSVSVPPATTLKIAWNHTFGLLWSLPVDYTTGSDTIIWQIRLPRLVLAACVGAGLAGAGAIYQGLFRNPLADPYLVGVAQGAALGAVMAIVLPLPAFVYTAGAVQWGAFIGAVIAVALVYNLARVGGEVRTATLLLAGVAIGSIGAAFTTLLTYLHNEKLTTIYGWLLGGFNAAGSWDNVQLIAPYLAIGVTVSWLCGRWLNVLQMGEERAAQLGMNVRVLKLALVASATLMAGAAVSVSGLIGFVGLVVPHMVRLLSGQDYRLLLPLSVVWGAIFMVLCDSVARTIISPAELPVSIITAFCGGPFFIYLMRRKKRMEGVDS